MNVPREDILNALEALLQGARFWAGPSAGQLAFVTFSRKYRSWDAVSEAEMPAGFLLGGFENADQQRAYGETTWKKKAVLWLYTSHEPTSDAIPGTALNYLLDAVEASLRPRDGENQTLGGLINHCYISGEVPMSEGQLPNDTKSVAVVPIVIDTGI